MCISKWRTASLQTMNNVLDFNNLFIRKGPECQSWQMSALFLKLTILYISYILQVFLAGESYIAAYMKQEKCVLLSRVNCILWNEVRNICYPLNTEVFQGKFHNASCSLRDLLKLSIWNGLMFCFLLGHDLVLGLANLTMISGMTFRGLTQWHFWEIVALIFSYVFFPLHFHIAENLVST